MHHAVETDPTPSTPPAAPQPSLPGFATRPTAWRAVRTPDWIARGARRLIGLFLILALVLAIVPWQQNARGTGRVIAYVPADRQQTVASPISGRIVRWIVREGEHVEAGQDLVEVADNDPAYLVRLQQQVATVELQLAAADAKIAAGDAKVSAALGARDAAIAGAEAKVTSAREKVRAAEQDLAGAQAGATTAVSQRDRAEALLADGLRSVQDVENARLKADQAVAKRAEAEAKLASARADLAAARGDLDKADTEAEGKIAEARSSLEAARSERASYEAKRLDAASKLARQETATVQAPTSGFVSRIHHGQGAEQVKAGDALALLVPDTESRAVELWLDGNDVALLRGGQEVRLQFEGWPALQFAGWPSVAMGTFGGTIDFIDATDDGTGTFRVMVLPKEGDAPWPAARLLRQGVPAKGWVMLGTVPLAYELWRQLNDFPPTVPPPSAKDVAGPKKTSKDPTPIEKDKAGKAWMPK